MNIDELLTRVAATPERKPLLDETIAKLRALHPQARIETEHRVFVRAYDTNDICVDVRNIAYEEES